jgi:pSer/pThr/pTyr-binding forkhead associated (FHA) protein
VAFPIQTLDQGDYTISVRATDSDGRVGAYATKPLKIIINRPPKPQAGAIAILQPATDIITRTQVDGSRPAVDTPLTSLTPMTVNIAVAITWPDGQDRQLKQVEYIIGDKTVVQTAPPFDQVVFPIDNFNGADYTIRVIATDEYGIKTEQIMPFTIYIDWPTPLPIWVTYAAMGLAVVALAFAVYMWWNPRFRRRVTQIAVNTGTAIATRIFGGSSSESMVKARLQRVGGGNAIPATIDLLGGINKIGRSSRTSTIVINDVNISRTHCQIEEQNDIFWITDSNSQNGTCVDGQKVGSNGQRLESGNIISMGPVKYRFELVNVPNYPDMSGSSTKREGTKKTEIYQQSNWDRAASNDDWAQPAPSTVPDTKADDPFDKPPGKKTEPSSPTGAPADNDNNSDRTQVDTRRGKRAK